MTILLAVDPGLRELGLAVFEKRVLKAAFLVHSPERTARGPSAWRAVACAATKDLDGHMLDDIDELVTEYPQVYRAGLQVGDQADLVEVAGVAGAVAGIFCLPTYGYLPAKWKGQVPKETHNARVLALLTPTERRAIAKCPASLRHNVIDAVGIGLYHLGRRGKRLGTGT